MTDTRGSAVRNQRLSLYAAVFPFVVLFAYLVIPALNIGFLSDDFVHLVEDATRPWYVSSDHLNRPLRDGLFRLMPSLFGLNPLPYRLLEILCYGFSVWLLWRFIRQLGISLNAAFTVTVLFVFFPRSHEHLFWFAAFQDVVVSCCILLACNAWLTYLKDGDTRSFIVSHFAYAVGLGFKETAVGFPAVLFCLELFTNHRDTPERFFSVIRRYLLFVPILAAFLAYVLLVGVTGSPLQETRGTYVRTSALGFFPPLARTLANIILQFSDAVSLGDLSHAQIAEVAAGCVLIAIAAVMSVNRKIALFSLCWYLIFAMPTAVFASAVNADRYLVLPYIAILLILATGLDRLYPFSRWQEIAFWVALMLFAVAGTLHLAEFREYYRAASQEARQVSREAMRLLNTDSLAPGEELVLVNLVHSRHVYVLNNGAKGALIEDGLPRQVDVVYNSANPGPKQQQFVESLKSCGVQPPPSQPVKVLLLLDGHMSDVSGACSLATIRADRAQRPEAWAGDHP